MNEERTKEEVERLARETARRMLSTPKPAPLTNRSQKIQRDSATKKAAKKLDSPKRG